MCAFVHACARVCVCGCGCGCGCGCVCARARPCACVISLNISLYANMVRWCTYVLNVCDCCFAIAKIVDSYYHCILTVVGVATYGHYSEHIVVLFLSLMLLL